MNGGYVVIGIDSAGGLPVLPPEGLAKGSLDAIQQKLFEYCNEIEPRYVPRIEVLKYQEKWVIYLWCPAGDDGPYKVQEDVTAKSKRKRTKEYWVKIMSSKTVAKRNELSELFERFASVPFDDRVNSKATMEDISRAHLEDYLNDSNSALYDDRNTMSQEDILIALEAANRSDVGVDIRNIGVLLFCDYPHKFLPEAKIELVHFHSAEEEASDDFTEITYTGPIQKQIRGVLDYMKNLVIIEKVVKHPDRAEADRFFTYPYTAIEDVTNQGRLHTTRNWRPPIGRQSVAATDRKQAIIEFLERQGQAKTADLIKVIGISDGRVRALLRAMVVDGTIEKVGDKRYTYYIIKERK